MTPVCPSPLPHLTLLTQRKQMDIPTFFLGVGTHSLNRVVVVVVVSVYVSN